MGSHYIQVGKLKVDSALLDIACPAAGYGSTPPNPATFCPANGYNQPQPVWETPVEMVAPSDNQILLLCDDMAQGVISLYCKTNTGSVSFELLNTDMTAVYSTTFATTINYTFPTYRTGKMYVIRLKPVTAGTYITQFYSANTWSGYVTDWRILRAVFNTPSITNLTNAFKGMTSFKECVFTVNMNSLTNLTYAFSTSGIEKVTWPAQMNALTSIAYMFEYTYYLKSHSFAGISLNALITYTYVFQFSEIESLVMQDTMNVANTTLLNFLYDARKLKTLVLPTSMTGVISITSMCRNCYLLESDLVFPNMPNVTGMASVIYYCYKFKSLKFTGASDLCTSVSNIISYCPLIDELVLPTSMNALTTLYNTVISSPIRKVTLPDSMLGLTTGGNLAGLIAKNTETLTKCSYWAPASLFSPLYDAVRMTTFDQPTMRVTKIRIGVSPTEKSQVTYVDIDWANSTYAGTSPQIEIYGELTATELNRIFTALPTVTGKTFKCLNNPGYASCNPAIATAKGWTVN